MRPVVATATWVRRFPNDEDCQSSEDLHVIDLTTAQREKLEHIFAHVFDMDRDDVISLQDFESFTERLRHFADWSTNCGEYIVLQQVQQGFVEMFLLPEKDDEDEDEAGAIELERVFLSLEGWLHRWSDLLSGVKTLRQLPIWLQYLPKVLFHAINTSGSKKITKDELRSFYSSVMGFQKKRVDEIIDNAYSAMTSNGDHEITYSIYELCFANLLLGKYPNGPGGYLFGYESRAVGSFPIDYTAMNTAPEDLEHYSPGKQSNRSSIVV